MNSKISQSALEFLVAIGVVIIFFTLVVMFFLQRYTVIETNNVQNLLESVSETIQEEIFIAKRLSGNYERNFSLPTEISGVDLTYSLGQGRELVVNYGDISQITFLPTYVYGDISPGENTILKKGSLIGICSSNCSDSYVFNATGTFQCSTFEGSWQSCDLSYGDSYVGIRVVCNTPPANLSIYNLDDSSTLFSGISSVPDDEYMLFEFLSSPFDIEDSGYWQLNSTCGAQPEQSSTYYVPYGELELQPLIISNCNYDGINDSYNCTENENFTITTTIECNGGECGDATIWLDPIASN